MHWAAEYIGRPWSQDNDCWAFFRAIQARHYERELPVIDIDSLSLREILRTFRDHAERARWVEVPSPTDGDGVLMGRNDRPIHVGVWLADAAKVLHCDQHSGVVAQDFPSLARHGWTNLRFYTPC